MTVEQYVIIRASHVALSKFALEKRSAFPSWVSQNQVTRQLGEPRQAKAGNLWYYRFRVGTGMQNCITHLHRFNESQDDL